MTHAVSPASNLCCSAFQQVAYLVQLSLHSQPAIFLTNAGLHCLVSGQPNNIFMTSVPKHNGRIFIYPYFLICLSSHTAANSYSSPFLSCPLLPSISDFSPRLQFMYLCTTVAHFPTVFPPCLPLHIIASCFFYSLLSLFLKFYFLLCSHMFGQ